MIIGRITDRTKMPGGFEFPSGEDNILKRGVLWGLRGRSANHNEAKRGFKNLL